MTRPIFKVSQQLTFSLVALGCGLAWWLRFVQDDAFISFVYARNLVEGEGLLWFGQKVEGYTNFAWVLWIALGLRLGVDPVPWSQISGIAAFAAAIIGLAGLGRHVFENRWVGLLAALLFVTNFSAVSYATGGLETMLQTSLLCLATLQTYRLRGAASDVTVGWAMLSGLLAVAVLTRLDSALPGSVLVASLVRPLSTARRPRQALIALALPFTLLVGGWTIWKLGYYGAFLPNSFHAKVGGDPGTVTANGFLYVGRFLFAYSLWPFLLLAARPGDLRATWPLWGLVLTWLSYTIGVGGDFMEFRLLVPIAPFLFLLIARGVLAPFAVRPRWARIAAGAASALLLASSVHHAVSFRGTTDDDTLDSISTLGTFYGHYPDGDWGNLGRALHRDLGATDIVIACHATGAIPWWSGLSTVDMWGLNDRELAVYGRRLGPEYFRPGHLVHSTRRDLAERGVHLVIGHPVLARRSSFDDPRGSEALREVVDAMIIDRVEPLGPARAVYLPVSPDEGLVLWYLMPHPAVDELIRSGRWSEHALP